MRKTLQSHWREYDKANGYSAGPNDEPGRQTKERHQAFMAGALTVLFRLDEIAKDPNDGFGSIEVEAMLEEAIEWCRLLGMDVKQPTVFK